MTIMLDMKMFGAKLREHRKRLTYTQDEVADRIGVSAQAVSKWESGECMPDVFNLKAIGELFNISIDVLLDTEGNNDITAVSERIGQIADEFIWAKEDRGENAHRDLGDDLWQIWKRIYFIEVGDKALQRSDFERGNLRICSDYGLKLWDDDGVACVIRSDLRSCYDKIGVDELNILAKLCSHDGLKLISLLDTVELTDRQTLSEVGITPERLNELLTSLLECNIIEYVSIGRNRKSGYKLCGHSGIAAYMILASAYILSKKKYTLSEYFPE